MGKLLNIVPSNLFRKKSDNETTKNLGTVDQNNDARQVRMPEREFVIDCKSSGSESEEQHEKTSTIVKTKSSLSTANKMPDNIMENLTHENVAEKFYNLERNYIFEQNNIMEKVQEEKSAMAESFKIEKLYMKRAFENEKMELLKEIERKDKMLFELAKVLKDEYKEKLEQEREKLLSSKVNLLNNIEAKLKTIIHNLNKIFHNNENAFRNLDEFKTIKDEYDMFSSLTRGVSLPKISVGNTEYITVDTSQRSVVTSEDYSSEHAELDVVNDTLSELLINKLGISKENSRREPELNPPRCMCERDRGKQNGTIDETAIQHELAHIVNAYRKQKCELLKLFSGEKEEFEVKLTKEKKEFEKGIRLEYEFRMTVERKAWQETIEDYEREVAILKYEREQMDRNYCIGMDEMKDEFEKEKMTIHRKYSETHALLKRSLSEKINTGRLVDK